MVSAAVSRYPVAALCVVLAIAAVCADTPKETEDAKGRENSLIPLVPVCQEDEFLTSNGTALYCRRLPDVGFCDCPGLSSTQEPMAGSGEQLMQMVPLPPAGCPVFTPPTRGAYVCLRNPDVIFCSVLCDHRFEFSATPRNPYSCGAETNFLWMDVAAGFVHTELPECTGFRHRLRMLHPSKFYLPAPCYGLTNHTILAILMEFQMELEYKGCDNCAVENTFLNCPSFEGTVSFYTEITAKEEYFTKK